MITKNMGDDPSIRGRLYDRVFTFPFTQVVGDSIIESLIILYQAQFIRRTYESGRSKKT
jgi:hypothetical protein